MSSSTTAAAKKWGKTASSYVRYFEPSGLVIGRYLLNCIKVGFQPNSLKIIEAGAGAGGLAKELLTCVAGLSLEQLYVTDVSDGMLEKASEKLEGFDDQVTIEKADYCKFDYKDNTFDRYYANMCLHYADDPDVVLQEASRILKPGGMAGFSVWGRSADSPVMTIVPDTLDALGLDKKDPSKRSNFHLGEDDAALRAKFLSNGFRKCSIIHIPLAMECFEPSDYVELVIDGAASTKAQIESFQPEDQKRVRETVLQRAKELLDAGKPMLMDMAIAVAQK